MLLLVTDDKLLAVKAEHLPTVANFLGFHPSIQANRISHAFGFSGFSASVNTACSSGLVAVDLACRELWLKQSELAVAACTNLIFDPRVTQRFLNSGWLSKRGQCRSLDATADGFVRSEGVGVVVLKPVEQALADGDRVYALIQDCRTRHNGQGNGLALACLQSQIDLLRDVYSSPGVDPADLLYVEVNAVGARVGDVIELKALAAALGKRRRGAQPLKLGSLKPNIGHSEAASGLAGLIKTALALHHQQLPPTLHFQSCDQSLNLEALGLSVPTSLEPIAPSAKPALAGISAFGFGGTNAHILLAESRQQVQPQASALPSQVMILSAASRNALRERCATLLDFLRSHPSLPLADISWTVNRSRSQLPVRLAIIAATHEQLQARLAQAVHSPHKSQLGVIPLQIPSRARPPKVAFVFTGCCTFSLDVLAEFTVHHETVRQSLDVAERLLGVHRHDDRPPALDHLVGELVLHQLWLAWGIEPSVYLAEPAGRASAAIAKAVAAGNSRLEAALQQLISPPDPEAALDWECPPPSVAMGEEWILLQVGSAKVGSSAELTELASPASGAAWDTLLEAAVHLAQGGVPVAWSKVCGSQHRRVVSLPTYPFARERHWIGEPFLPTTKWCAGDLGQRVHPATPLEHQLHALWSEVLGQSDFGMTDNFFSIGGHSLNAAALAERIETSLRRAMPLAFIFRFPTLAAQAAWLQNPDHQAPNHLVTLQPLGARLPIYVVHGLGGKLGHFIALARAFSPHRPVFGIQNSGDRPPLNASSMKSLAEIYAKEILAAHPGGPIHLVGFSAGGWYAYAVAEALLKCRAPIGLLAMIDTYPTTRISRRLRITSYWRVLRSELLHHQFGLLPPPPEQLRWRYVLDRMRALNRSAAVYLRFSLPGPRALKDFKKRLQGKAPPPPDPYLHLLKHASKPPRLPLRVDLFAPQEQLPFLIPIWRFYARRCVRGWPLFHDHFDFIQPELAKQLADALEIALHEIESSDPGLS